jgi:UDP-glucose 4-epimerase
MLEEATEMDGRTYLVTGGAGFIGSHIVDALAAQGHAVTVVDDLSSGKRSNLGAGITLAVGDVRDKQTPVATVLECVDCIFHLAAQIDTRRVVKDPVLDMQVIGADDQCASSHSTGAFFHRGLA